MASNQPIIELSSTALMGDLLMATAVLPELKTRGYRIRFVCREEFAPILAGHPLIDELITGSAQEVNRREKSKALEPPEQIIVLTTPGYQKMEIPPPVYKHFTTHLCDVVGVAPTDTLSIDISEETDHWGKQYTDCVLIHATAKASPYRNWPLDRWSELAQQIQTQWNLPVRQLRHGNDPGIFNVQPLKPPDVKQAAAALKHCKLFIGVDSLFNHVSRAFTKPSIILWGSTHPETHGYRQNINLINGQTWHPDQDRQHLALPCQPCFRNFEQGACPNTVPTFYQVLPESLHPKLELHSCMANQTVDAAMQQVNRLLSTPSTRPR